MGLSMDFEAFVKTMNHFGGKDIGQQCCRKGILLLPVHILNREMAMVTWSWSSDFQIAGHLTLEF